MKIAITGGIGSGKSYVCQYLRQLGIHVYDCDAAAKRLLAEDIRIQQSLRQLVGNEVYTDGVLQKKILAQYILKSAQNKQAVNDVVHPAVALDFIRSGCSWLESAILFESGFDKRVDFDCIVCVSAPLKIRINRIMRRDGISEEKALQWINCQMSQEKMESRSNYVIINDGEKNIEGQFKELFNNINKK